VKGVHGEKFRTPDLGQQPVLGIKEIPRTGSCETIEFHHWLSLISQVGMNSCKSNVLSRSFAKEQSAPWSQWRTQKIFMGGLVQGHMVVICIWCALFVTSQFDIISMFPNQRFGEVC